MFGGFRMNLIVEFRGQIGLGPTDSGHMYGGV